MTFQSAQSALLPHEPRIESLLARLASFGVSLQPSSSARLHEWPTQVVDHAAARAQVIGAWLSAHPTPAPSDAALGLAAALLLSEIRTVASFLRSSTDDGLARLDLTKEGLDVVRKGLDGHVGGDVSPEGGS